MRYHFIAIGGAVMHNLALELAALGNDVSGSDDEIFDPAKSRLEKAGILPEKQGWFPEKITGNLDAVILGMHARGDNPELIKVKELGIPVYSFPEFIYEHSKNKTRVVIGGSHGKTTCTAMLMHALKKHGLEFDYLVGSQLSGFERMVKLSDAPLIIIEGDEYLTSALQPIPKFHLYKPHLAMLTGIAWDHVNVFPTFENYLEQFEIFEKTMVKSGKLFWFNQDQNLQKISENFTISNQWYNEPEFQISEKGTRVHFEGRSYDLSIFGRHNLQNAEGVRLLASELGISGPDYWKYMEDFSGTAKRLEKIFESENRIIYRDFAHAPSKVQATVSAIRDQYPDQNFVSVFELHTYSSLRSDFLPGYAGTMNPADKAFVLFDPHVYELKKMPVPETSEIENAIGNCVAFSNPDLLKKAIATELNSGKKTILLLMSSGNFGGISPLDFSEN
ncbi:MAG: peptidoglycan synthetase [Bacteroidetes bacterium]|nr:peptidoglycan synthetase [Bacteroidota bacterium]